MALRGKVIQETTYALKEQIAEVTELLKLVELKLHDLVAKF